MLITVNPPQDPAILLCVWKRHSGILMAPSYCFVYKWLKVQSAISNIFCYIHYSKSPRRSRVHFLVLKNATCGLNSAALLYYFVYKWKKLRSISNMCAVFLMLISFFFMFRLIWVLALYFSTHFVLCEMFIMVIFYWIFMHTYFVKCVLWMDHDTITKACCFYFL